ncbi:NACHT domain-containing protein [Streptomyces palmae]|uniref:Serine protease n=1 Tax=Streptomyces palmae TaxID=1701085 RepID=A0A4Z0H7Y8_9ACTN|nr:NACHT domain-containing protein [Streptomyces palmae]TGB11184.1 serine protease [Streptomyces palmae]
MTGRPRAAERAVVVQSGNRQGSGVMINPVTALTCAHVLADPLDVSLAHPFFGGPVGCDVTWSDSTLDLALLTVNRLTRHRNWIDGPMRWRIRLGEITTSAPVPDCEIVGFPGIQRYGQAVRAKHRKTRIFGLDALTTRERTWDLDTAYLSLEAQGASRSRDRPDPDHAPGAAPTGRIEELLANRLRTLLRGEAGAGKTTLLSWLAAHLTDGTLPAELSHLHDLVPLFVPLRNLAPAWEFPDAEQLPKLAKLQTGTAPDGWAHRLLRSGRVYLLVDGLDEVPPARREDARTWLAELLELYPDIRCLVTVRPGAVDGDWLRSERFRELTLLPMSDEDIDRFVTSWHDAARQECAGYGDEYLAEEEQTELDELEEDLHRQFDRNAELSTLARTPLLCAVICALHRSRGGLLPETRWELYKATLAMLLGGRDSNRRIGAPEGVQIGLTEHLELLQTLAVWLVRCGQNQLTREEATQQLQLAMRMLPRVCDQGTPDKVLTHLLNRSGVLQERHDGMVQFIHRTFQDYLAAKALVENGGLRELLRQAHDETWQDVILMSVGHCRPPELIELIEGLIRQSDALPPKAEDRERLHTLAARCARDTVRLSSEIQQTVNDRVRAMLPPRSEDSRRRLASLGPALLSHLPDPDPQNDDEGEWVANLIGLVGGREAMLYAKRLLGHPGKRTRQALASSWLNIPAREYAEEVLAKLPLDDLDVVVTRPRQLELLASFGPMHTLSIVGSYTSEALEEHVAGLTVSHLFLFESADLTSLDFSKRLTATYSLWLGAPLRDIDMLSSLARASHIQRLGMSLVSCSEFASVSQSLPHITDLTVWCQPPEITGIAELPRVFPSLAELHLSPHPEGTLQPPDLTPLVGLPDLKVFVNGKQLVPPPRPQSESTPSMTAQHPFS